MGLTKSEIKEWVEAQYPKDKWDTMMMVYSRDNERFSAESRRDFSEWKEGVVLLDQSN